MKRLGSWDERRAWGSGVERRRAALAAAEVEVGFVHVHGLRLRYARSRGVGEPLLFCNGIGANLELALPLVRALTGTPVILFDVPGTGSSPKAWFWPGFAGYARLAVGLLDALACSGQFSVAGVSWGGALAQQIARDHPQRVRRLVLMATTYGSIMIPGKPSALLRMITPQRYVSRTYMARNAATVYGGAMRHRPDLAIELAAITQVPATLSYLQQLASVATFLSVGWLHRISCPALVLAGDDDPIVRPINARILAMLLRDSRLHLIPGGGHLFMATHATQTAALISAFLAEAPTPPCSRGSPSASRRSSA